MKRLDTQIYEPTNQNPIKFLNLLSQRIKKRYYKTLETSVINSPLSLEIWNMLKILQLKPSKLSLLPNWKFNYILSRHKFFSSMPLKPINIRSRPYWKIMHSSVWQTIFRESLFKCIRICVCLYLRILLTAEPNWFSFTFYLLIGPGEA